MTPRPKRPRKQTDGPAYHEMMTRLIRRAGVRAGNDTGELALLADVRRATDRALTDAVIMLRADGATWDEIGAALGMARQHARRTYGPAVDAALAADAAARADLAVA